MINVENPTSLWGGIYSLSASNPRRPCFSEAVHGFLQSLNANSMAVS
jgi:hypothetical protein